MLPDRAKRRRMKLRKPATLLRSDRSSQHANRIDRKMRTELGRDAVAFRPALKIRDVVTRFALNRNRTRVAGGLHDRAEQSRPINDLSPRAPHNRRQLRIGEIAERTHVVVKELDLLRHRAPRAAVLLEADLAQSVSIYNRYSPTRAANTPRNCPHGGADRQRRCTSPLTRAFGSLRD